MAFSQLTAVYANTFKKTLYSVKFLPVSPISVKPAPTFSSAEVAMGMVHIDSLEAGMVLASDVHDRTGRLLLGSGAELSQKHLSIFRSWGVDEADIAGMDSSFGVSQLPEDITQEELSSAEDALRPLFGLAGPDHPVLHELLRLAALKKVLNDRE